MSRVINTASPAKARNHARRTIAEILRRLMRKAKIDDEVRDMAATLVYCLRDIDATTEITCSAWEKRNYFVKADRFRLDWEWVASTAGSLAEVIATDRWYELPLELARLAPRFADIRVAKMTRSPDVWAGAYDRLMTEASQ